MDHDPASYTCCSGGRYQATAAFRARGVNDLDNVLRNYIIPKIVDVLQPPAHLAWTIDMDELNRKDSKLQNFWRRNIERLPRSMRIGVTRYDVWRLPRHKSDKSPGFVSVAVVADMLSGHDVLDQIDNTIERWEQHVDL